MQISHVWCPHRQRYCCGAATSSHTVCFALSLPLIIAIYNDDDNVIFMVRERETEIMFISLLNFVCHIFHRYGHCNISERCNVAGMMSMWSSTFYCHYICLEKQGTCWISRWRTPQAMSEPCCLCCSWGLGGCSNLLTLELILKWRGSAWYRRCL